MSFNASPINKVHQEEHSLRSKITKAVKRHIPSGGIRNTRPNFPTVAARLIDERDTLRSSDPTNPRQAQFNEINKLVNIDKCPFNHNSNYFWNVIKNLANKTPNTATKHQSISSIVSLQTASDRAQ